MEFRTIVDIADPGFRIGPCEEMLFVGSCFATEIGRRFQEEKFRATVNPFGVMYNPASILHTIEQLSTAHYQTVFLTLGTNHVYRLKETGEIVDNCQKRPQSLFTEEELSVDQCADYLTKAVALLRQMNPDVHIVLTVSPIRYRKYGYHGSQLSKATLLLAIDKVVQTTPAPPDSGGETNSSPLMIGGVRETNSSPPRIGEVGETNSSPFMIGGVREANSSPPKIGGVRGGLTYFPAYEIVNDELRDYRFYKADMLHPSDQTVEYLWQRLSEVYLSDEAKTFIQEWAPLKAVLHHRPFNPDSEEYRALMDKTMLKVAELQKKYPNFAV